MLRLRLLLVAVLAVSALAVLTSAAGAAAPAANAKFCAATAQIGDGSGATPVASQLRSVAADFKSAARSAPPKVKRAMLSLASMLSGLRNKKSAELLKAFADKDFVAKYTKAQGTYAAYYKATCSS